MAKEGTLNSSMTFTNPIITGFNPDPSIVRVGSDYFLTTSTFEYFPGLPLYHSKDLVNWRLFGHALTRRSQLDMRTVEPGGGIWAPTLRWRADVGGPQGRFYVTTCAWSRYRPKSDERIFPRGFYVYTDDIWNDDAWSDPIYFDNPGFDQDLFWDDDGKVYLSTTMRISDRPANSTQKDFAIHVSEIDLETGSTLVAPIVIRDSPHGLAEGSHIIKRGKYYYLFTAEGGTEAGHQEWVSRSEEGPLGPWTLGPRNPLWYNGPNEEVQSTGHADVFEDAEGAWWAVLLGNRPPEFKQRSQTQLGRESYLVRVDWEDDWPIFNGGENITLETQGHALKLQQARAAEWTADFSQSTLEPGWYQKNTPLKQSYKIKDNALTILGNCHSLSSPEAPALLLRKQTAFSQTFSATLSFRPTRYGAEAGVVLWWSMYSYVKIGVTRVSRHGDGLQLVVGHQKNAELERVDLVDTGAIAGSVRLIIKGTPTEYKLSVARGEEQQVVHSASMLDVVKDPPVGGAFTGMMWGLYAFGDGEPCLDPAVFSDVRIESSW